MSRTEPCLEPSVFRVRTNNAAAPVSKSSGVEQFAPPEHGLLRWLDNWFGASPEERMRNASLAYWS